MSFTRWARLDRRPRPSAVRNGDIVLVGTDAEARDLVGPNTEEVALDGRMLLPGFQDAHVHASTGRPRADAVQPQRGARARRVPRPGAQVCRDAPDAPWILGGGWALHIFRNGIPTRETLDEVGHDRPVFLSNRDHHGAWDSRALELAGVTAQTKDPPCS